MDTPVAEDGYVMDDDALRNLMTGLGQLATFCDYFDLVTFGSKTSGKTLCCLFIPACDGTELRRDHQDAERTSFFLCQRPTPERCR